MLIFNPHQIIAVIYVLLCGFLCKLLDRCGVKNNNFVQLKRQTVILKTDKNLSPAHKKEHKI
jgi:hypothetical protein